METFSLSGRTAFVVGGNSGIGRAIVDLFATDGAKIDRVERRYGHIILTSSQLAYKGAPGLAYYCAAKAGVTGFNLALGYAGICS